MALLTPFTIIGLKKHLQSKDAGIPTSPMTQTTLLTLQFNQDSLEKKISIVKITSRRDSH
jgi:hypothetical protein